jgi:hypothetical protein
MFNQGNRGCIAVLGSALRNDRERELVAMLTRLGKACCGPDRGIA